MVYIIILLYILLSILALFPPNDKAIKNIWYIVLGIALICITGFRGSGVDKDHEVYIDMFNDSGIPVEFSFSLISKFIHFFLFSKPLFLFLIYAIIGVGLKLIAIRRLTDLWFLSIVIYCSNFYMLHDMTQIRVGVASGLLLFCVEPIYENNWIKFLLFALLAFMFHYSALLIMPLFFLNSRPSKIWLLASIPFGYLFYFSGINLVGILPIPGIKEKLEIYTQLQEAGDEQWNSINVFNLLFLAKIIIFYFLIWKYDLIVAYNKFTPILLKIYSVSLMSFLIFAKMPVIAFRINELFGIVDIVLIPLLSYTFMPQIFARSIVLFIGLNILLIVLFYNKLILF